GLLEIAGRHYPEAERSLRRAVDLERKVPLSTITASARLMLAHLYQIRNRPDEALAELSPTLTECQRDGTPGFILKEGPPIVVPLLRLAVERNVHAEYAAHLLGLTGMPGAPGPVRVPETGETLTSREVEILRLIAVGDGNRAIAAKLVISLPTVKSHVASLLRKLNVGNRTQAAAHARDLRLL
ncbi:MAG: response regulator transcription factor, partial [Chloroflexi bacterium]|nr:response regulator transcription factor [Chloroflexota bacterium]